MFAGKVVLVTGSSSGIGAGTVIHFARLGASVVVTGRNIEKLNKVAKQCEEVSKKKPLIISGDLGEDEFVKTLIDKTIKHYKRLDVLVNNAALGTRGGIQTSTMEDYRRVFKVNLESVYYLTKLAVPHLIETKGNIINISSTAGLRPAAAYLDYCMAKSALDHFTRCLALELASKGVRVNCVNPGPVKTNLRHTSYGMTNEQVEEVYKIYNEKVPLAYVAVVDEITPSIIFLAGEEASYITGVNLPVDGGLQLI